MKIEELPHFSALVSWPAYKYKSTIVRLLLVKKYYHDFRPKEDIIALDDVSATEYKIDDLSLGYLYWFSLTAVNRFGDKSYPLKYQHTFQLTGMLLQICIYVMFVYYVLFLYLGNCKFKVSWSRFACFNVDHLYLRTTDAAHFFVETVKLSTSDISCIVDTSSFDSDYISLN